MKELIKKWRLLKSITKIVNAIIKEDIEVSYWDERDYLTEKWNAVLKIKGNNILTDKWTYSLSKIFWVIWYNLFTDRPSDFVPRLKEAKMEHAFALSSLEELRVKNQMMYYYPWTRDLFFKAAQLDKISIDKVNNLPLHRKFLYYINQDFYNLTFIEPKLDKIIKVYNKYSKELIKANSLDGMMKVFDEKLLKLYFEIFEKEEKEDQQDKEEDNKEPENSMEDSISNMKDKSDIEEDTGLQEIIWEEEIQPEWVDMEYIDLYHEFSHLIPKFTRKLNSILKDNNINRTWWAYRTWKLNTKKLYKIATGDNKLFTRKESRRHKDYMVGLLVDCSGSMHWNKIKLAVQSAWLMAEVLNKVGIKFEIVGFDLDYTKYKSVNQDYWIKQKNKLVEMLNFDTSYWGNNDWYAIRKTNHDMITNSSENTERILIVLSDWLPAEAWELDNADAKLFKKERYSDFDLEEEVRKASGYTKVIWIWIQDRSVIRYYKDNLVIQDIDTLPEALLNKLKHNIKRW